MNVPQKTSHNANLPVTITKNGRIVNGFGYITDSELSYDEAIIEDAIDNCVAYTDDNSCVDTAEQSASVLFVKISNNIFKYNLKPKVVELYVIIALIIKTKPKFRFSYRVLVNEYKAITHNNINKDTVTKYINILVDNNLLYIGTNKNYHLGINTNIQDSESNYYDEPKSCYTPFYSKIYNYNITKTEAVLDHYIASKPYRRLRRTKVTREVNISLSTNNHLLQSLRIKNIIYRNTIINKNIKYRKMYYYYPVTRNVLKRDYEDDKIIRYVIKREELYEARMAKVSTTIHPSRYWYVGKMGELMKKYKIKYIKAFENYNIQDAYDIIKEMERQGGHRLSAPLIVKAILEGYNWDKIVARRHDQVKKNCL